MQQEFNFINFYRALAAFWVMCAHCMIWGDWYGVPLPSAKIAVDLFMIISGFLMAANAAARITSEPLTSFKNCKRFWLRRWFRLAPAYYLSLILAAIISTHFLGGYHALQMLNPGKWGSGGIYDPMRIEFTWQNLLLHFSFLFGLHPQYSFSTFLPDWSLSLEMQFYLLFPFLVIVMQRFGAHKTGWYLGIASIVASVVVRKFIHFYEPSFLPLKLHYFIAGMLVFQALTTSTRRDRTALTLCATVLVSLEFGYKRELFALPLLIISMFAVSSLEARNTWPNWLKALMQSRAIRFASDISYGVYLFHGFFISACGWLIVQQPALLELPPAQRVAFMLLFVSTLTSVTAYLVHLVVELPGIQLGKRFIARFAPATAAPRVTPSANQPWHPRP